MKSLKFSVISQALLWVAVIVLAVLYFSKEKSSKPSVAAASGGSPRIAYFSLDSLQERYEYFLSMKRTLQAKQAQAEEELSNIEKKFQSSVKSYEQRVPTMTQSQAEQEQKIIYGLREQFDRKKQELQMKLMEDQAGFIKKIQQSIEEYIKSHPDEYPYDMVIANQPGLVFYENGNFDITTQLLEDLNKAYSAK